MIVELSRTQIVELHRASSKMTGARRRAFQAEIALKYCNGSPRLTETVFGWSRSNTVRLDVFDLAKFTTIVDRMRESIGQKIEGSPIKAVEVASKTFSLNQGESDGVLNHLIRGGDLSAYGLLNAITRTAQDVESYDRSTELEAIGSKVLALPKSTWKEIALAQ